VYGAAFGKMGSDQTIAAICTNGGFDFYPAFREEDLIDGAIENPGGMLASLISLLAYHLSLFFQFLSLISGYFFPANLRTGKSPITRCKQIKNLGENRQKRTKSVRICRFSLLFPCKTGKTGPRPVRSGLRPPPFSSWSFFTVAAVPCLRNSAFWRSEIRPMLVATPERFQSRAWQKKPQNQRHSTL
jgi:hypothetical protein